MSDRDDTTSREVWKPVVGFDGYYEVSNHGRVMSLGRIYPNTRKRIYGGNLITEGTNHNGYGRVTLTARGREKTFPTHRLVLEAFVGPCPNGMECRHLDNNRKNNRLSNLVWGTKGQNAADRVTHGTKLEGEKVCSHKLRRGDVVAIREARRRGESYVSIAERFGVSNTTASYICRGKSWKHTGEGKWEPVAIIRRRKGACGG